MPLIGSSGSILPVLSSHFVSEVLPLSLLLGRPSRPVIMQHRYAALHADTTVTTHPPRRKFQGEQGSEAKVQCLMTSTFQVLQVMIAF